MQYIHPREYENALEIVKKYEEQIKCKHINTIHVLDYNSFPYGVDYEYDRCNDCGEIINLKQI